MASGGPGVTRGPIAVNRVACRTRKARRHDRWNLVSAGRGTRGVGKPSAAMERSRARSARRRQTRSVAEPCRRHARASWMDSVTRGQLQPLRRSRSGGSLRLSPRAACRPGYRDQVGSRRHAGDARPPRCEAPTRGRTRPRGWLDQCLGRTAGAGHRRFAIGAANRRGALSIARRLHLAWSSRRRMGAEPSSTHTKRAAVVRESGKRSHGAIYVRAAGQEAT
jgi:hypothetical protein